MLDHRYHQALIEFAYFFSYSENLWTKYCLLVMFYSFKKTKSLALSKKNKHLAKHVRENSPTKFSQNSNLVKSEQADQQ